MKERPILFTPENAQKCHDGRKTQTRRIVKPQPHQGISSFHFLVNGWKPGWSHFGEATNHDNRIIVCPYGQVGDRLWVREAHSPTREGGYIYKGWPMFKDADAVDWKWTPSLHMPRKACRTVLEIIEVRVERVQDCSEADAIAEGIEHHNGGEIGHSGYRHDQSHGYVYATAQEAYKALWLSINGAGSWALNPWVWVLTFKRVDG